MNKHFNFSRFGKYFLYDLRNAGVNYGVNMLMISLMPFLMFLLFEAGSLIIKGTGTETDLSGVGQIVGMITAFAVMLLGSPAALYGRVTDKRKGTDFLLVPASVSEKFLSMILIVCVVVPAVGCLGLGICDSLMSAIFPMSYGDSLFTKLGGVNIFNIEDPSVNGFSVNLGYVLILSYISTVLFMTLGAVFFKKAKVAKTIMASIAFGIALSPISAGILKATGFFEIIMEADELQGLMFLNSFFNWAIWLQVIAYAVLVFLRLKTIKH